MHAKRFLRFYEGNQICFWCYHMYRTVRSNEQMLCNSTTKWVFGTQLAGPKHIFGILKSFSIANWKVAKKREKCENWVYCCLGATPKCWLTPNAARQHSFLPFLLVFCLQLKRMLKFWNILFWSLNRVQSTCLLVKIHNEQKPKQWKRCRPDKFI